MATCSVCHDTGCCPNCEGRGAITSPFGHLGLMLPCAKCFGQGDCPECTETCDAPNIYDTPTEPAKPPK